MLAHLRHGLGEHLKANIAGYFLVTLIFMIGIVVGAMAIKLLPDAQKIELANYLKIFFSEIVKDTHNATGIFGSVLFNHLKMVLIVWILGFTIIGIPFVLFLIFTKGFIIGFTVGFLVNEYVLKGVAFALVSVLPHNFLAVPLLLAVSVAAIRFSIRLIRRRKQVGNKLFADSVNYSIVCAIVCVGMLASTLVEVYVSPIFMKLTASLFL